MGRHVFLLLFFLILLISFTDCARRGRPEGGPKDEDAPIMVTAKPPHFTKNFNAREIKIYFDEYIKLKDLQTQLIVSPPLKYQPIIAPQGIPSKYISIKILDTLKGNTTYTFNFGQSVVDNNEGNVLRNFKYVFSTGDVIDSLEISGMVKDAFQRKADDNITIMLYEINEQFNDSAIYKEKPYYVGSTLDTTMWQITNIKAGKYMLIALKDANRNYLFNPKSDKIGYLNQPVIIPDDSIVALNLFKEEIPFKLDRASEVAKGHLLVGFEGQHDSLQIKPLGETTDFEGMYLFEKGKDSLDYWFKGNVADSLFLNVFTDKVSDTAFVKFRTKNIDSLQVGTSTRGTLNLRDKLKLTGSIPLVAIDTNKVSFIDGDSINVKYLPKIIATSDEAAIQLDFDKKVNSKYKITLYPDALTDFFGNTNRDTLNYNLSTKSPADYGNLYLTLQNVKAYPVIVELLTEKGELIEQIYATEPRSFDFVNLSPDKYVVRIIYDENKNGKWDTGNFLLRLQPEKVVYYPEVIEVRANWDKTETFILE